MIKIAKSLLLSVILLTLLPGCGYRIGSLMHPEIKSIAVAPVKNRTLGYHLAADVRKVLCERVMVDGSLKLKDLGTADCILYATVTDIHFSEVADVSRDQGDNYHANEWSATVKIKFTVIIPGRKKPLLPPTEVDGTANFQGYGDIETGREQGVQQACYDAATKVVQAITEAW